MLNFEKGEFFNNNGDLRQDLNMSYKKVKEFTLIPQLDYINEDEDGIFNEEDMTYGWYSIDGEKYTPAEIHGRTMNKQLCVMCLFN